MKVTIAYDGAPWSGWQSQPDGTGVQDQLESAVEAVTGRKARIHGSGRTDAGVHALGQCAHMDPPEGADLDAEQWLRALNVHLPGSIRIMDAAWVTRDFHARFSAERKEYRYRMVLGNILPPEWFGRAWLIRRKLDIGLLNDCLSLVPGRHDFRRLHANNGKARALRKQGREADREAPDAVRGMHSAEALRWGSMLEIRLLGEGFLYRQARMMVAAMIRVAAGQESTAWWKDLLENPEGRPCPHAAPADGLTLARVFYGTEEDAVAG